MPRRDDERQGPNFYQPFPLAGSEPARLDYVDEDRARHALMHLRDSGWSWQAALEKVSRDMRLPLTAITRQCVDLRWELPRLTAAVKRARDIVGWLIAERIFEASEWTRVQDHWCVSKSNAVKLIRQARHVHDHGAPAEREPVLLRAAQWLRSPRIRPTKALQEAINELYTTRGPTYYASRPL